LGTVGIVRGDQVEPFQTSAAVAGAARKKPFPTAMQKTAVTQERFVSLFVVLGVAVVGIVVQLDALTCAGAVSAWEFAAPTALPPVSMSGNVANAIAKPTVNTRTTERIPTPGFQ
jgi:hypothetical protein